MWKRYSILLIILIIAAAAFLRLYKINAVPPGLYPDEAMNGDNALEALYGPKETDGFSAKSGSAFGGKVFYPDNNGREGLFINIQALSILVFGNEPWALRIISALFGIFTVLGLYFLTKELFKNYEIRNNTNLRNKFVIRSDIIALLSSFFLAVSFWHINFSRIGFRAIMVPFFLIWSLYLIIKTLKRIQESKPYILYSIISGAAYGLGFYSYIAYRITPLIIFIIFLFYLIVNKEWLVRKKILIAAFWLTLSAIIIFLPLGLYFLNHPQDFLGRSTQVSIFASENPISTILKNTAITLGMFNIYGDCNWRHNYACSPQLDFITGIFFLAGIIFSLVQIFKKRNYKEKNFKMLFVCGLLVSGFFIMLLPVVLSNEGLPHALRAIGSIGFVYIFAGLGAYFIIAKIIEIIQKMDMAEINKTLNLSPSQKLPPLPVNEKSVLKIIAIIIIAILFISQTYYLYFINWANNKNVFNEFSGRYVQIGKYLNSLPLNIPKYVVMNTGGITYPERYTDRKIPTQNATVMFITNTFLPFYRAQKHIFYVFPDELEKMQIEKDAIVVYLEPN